MIKVATIVNTHGLKGVVKVILHTDRPDIRFADGAVLWVGGKELRVVSYFSKKGMGYVRFEGIESIEQAETLKGLAVEIDEDSLEDLGSGHMYYVQMMDCTVFDTTGRELGKVVDVLETGVHPVLRVSGPVSCLVPFHPAYVKESSVREKKIVIEWVEGL